MNERFGNIKNYTKNPLGILALFIVLLYGIASLLLGVASKEFTNLQEWALILFLIFFPIIVFLGFYRLVTKYHQKLYSPKDFNTDESFLKTLPQIQQIEKLNIEAKQVFDEMSDESQKTSIIYTKSSIISNIILAEDLVFRDLELEYGITIKRHIGESVAYGFDGYFFYRNMEVLVEIKYTEKGNWDLISEKLIPQIKYLDNKDFIFKPYFLVVIVGNGLTKKQIEIGKEIIIKKLSLFSMRVKCKAYSLEKLKYRYQFID